MVEESLQSFQLFIYPSLAAPKGMAKETEVLSCVRISLGKAFLRQKVNFGGFHGAVWISSSPLFLSCQLLHTTRRLSWTGETREKSCFSGKLELVLTSLCFQENRTHLCSALRSRIKLEVWKSEILTLISACYLHVGALLGFWMLIQAQESPASLGTAGMQSPVRCDFGVCC